MSATLIMASLSIKRQPKNDCSASIFCGGSFSVWLFGLLFIIPYYITELFLARANLFIFLFFTYLLIYALISVGLIKRASMNSIIKKLFSIAIFLATIVFFVFFLWPLLHYLSLLIFVLFLLALIIFFSYRSDTSIPYLDAFLKNFYYKVKFTINYYQNGLDRQKNNLRRRHKILPVILLLVKIIPQLFIIFLLRFCLKFLHLFKECSHGI